MLATEMLARQEMIDIIKKVYESYGYTPLDTPAIERYETLQGKYGEEGEKLMYKFTDNGGRKIALRYDLTVPLARVVAQYKEEITLPYKRYQIGNVWRGESPQAGRYREFVQFDADIVGTKSLLADAEVIMMMCDTMKALGVKATVRVNNRKILDGLSQKAKITDPQKAKQLISIIDKAEKMGTKKAVEEIASQFGKKEASLVEKFLKADGQTKERLEKIKKIIENQKADEGISELMQVFAILEEAGYSNLEVVFDQTIARGLDYYTGTIYETTLLELPQIGSVCSGGRYDNLIAALSDNKVNLPAVGTSVGVDRLFAALTELKKTKPTQTKSQVLIVNFNQEESGTYAKLAAQLRQAGIAAEVYYEAAKLDKQLKYADKLGIPWTMFAGPEEIEKELVKVKNMQTREQKTTTLKDFILLLG